MNTLDMPSVEHLSGDNLTTPHLLLLVAVIGLLLLGLVLWVRSRRKEGKAKPYRSTRNLIGLPGISVAKVKFKKPLRKKETKYKPGDGDKRDVQDEEVSLSSSYSTNYETEQTSDQKLKVTMITEKKEDKEYLGKLFFTLKYSFEKSALIVSINKCINLPSRDPEENSSDPYIKLEIIPEKEHKVKTKIVRNTLDPVFDEDFTFYGIHFNRLQILSLHFEVLRSDRFSRDDVIGEVLVELEGLDLRDSSINSLELVRDITPRGSKLASQGGLGELLVSLCHQPGARRMTCVVLKARNLPRMDLSGLSDPYVKIYLHHNGQRIAKKKTHIKKRSLNPVYNESFVFDLPSSEGDISSTQLEFLVLDWDRVTRNEVIGRLSMGGPGCVGSAQHHWEEIQSYPRRQIAMWHKLTA